MNQQAHFIAIGGSAMHNLAIALHRAGATVTGSDDEIFEPSRSRLKKYGLLPPEEGWFPERIHSGLDAVILGMHAKKDNPELSEAEKSGVTIYSYPEFLYRHSCNKKRVVIGGSHGKTTTTAMILHVLHYNNINADFMVGAQLAGFETMVQLSEEAPVMILEGDEYLTSPVDLRPKFHLYKPHTAVITGIAWDHMNVFPTFDNYVEQFRIFAGSIMPGGTLIYCSADAELERLIRDLEQGDIHQYGYGLPGYRVKEGVVYITAEGYEWPMKVIGQHNLMNMEAARLVCEDLGLDGKAFYEAMQSFEGASGRLEKLYDDGSLTVIKDFAHAPSKLKATIGAVKEAYPGRNLIAVMELHTFSSLNKQFLPQYASSMQGADTKAVFYSPHTLEMKKLPAITAEEVYDFFNDNTLAVITSPGRLERYLRKHLQKNSVLLLMSSGNFGGVALQELIRELESKQ
jgi:UDP-N-acetylmuramate: L-alanyl-gamma-D-glutamyl-meso-diaminopimelate ligase